MRTGDAFIRGVICTKCSLTVWFAKSPIDHWGQIEITDPILIQQTRL